MRKQTDGGEVKIHKYWSLYTFFNVLHLIFAYRKSSITKVIEIENGKDKKKTLHYFSLHSFAVLWLMHKSKFLQNGKTPLTMEVIL